MLEPIRKINLLLLVLLLLGFLSRLSAVAGEEKKISTSLDAAAEEIVEQLKNPPELNRKGLKFVVEPIRHSGTKLVNGYHLSKFLSHQLKSKLRQHGFRVIKQEHLPTDPKLLLKEKRIDALLTGEFVDREDKSLVEVQVSISISTEKNGLEEIPVDSVRLKREQVEDLLVKQPQVQYENAREAAQIIASDFRDSVEDVLFIAVAPVIEPADVVKFPERSQLGQEIQNAFDQALVQHKGLFNVQARKEWKQIFNELSLEQRYYFDPKTITTTKDFWKGIDALLTIRYSVEADYITVEALLIGISEKSMTGVGSMKGLLIAGDSVDYEKPKDIQEKRKPIPPSKDRGLALQPPKVEEDFIRGLSQPDFQIKAVSEGKKEVALPKDATQLDYQLAIAMKGEVWLAQFSYDADAKEWGLNPPNLLISPYKKDKEQLRRDDQGWYFDAYADFGNSTNNRGALIFVVAHKRFHIPSLTSESIEAGLSNLKKQLDEKVGKDQWAIDLITYSQEQ